MAASMLGVIFKMARWSGATSIVAAAVARTPFIITRKIRSSAKSVTRAGQGRMTYRASYQNGRIEKVEKDSTGQGRPDLWLFYDTSRDGEIVVKEERDLNGDGVADLWSFYDNGRLVRRDVNAPGLEILSKQDQVPLPTAEIRPPAIPGS